MRIPLPCSNTNSWPSHHHKDSYQEQFTPLSLYVCMNTKVQFLHAHICIVRVHEHKSKVSACPYLHRLCACTVSACQYLHKCEYAHMITVRSSRYLVVALTSSIMKVFQRVVLVHFQVLVSDHLDPWQFAYRRKTKYVEDAVLNYLLSLRQTRNFYPTHVFRFLECFKHNSATHTRRETFKHENQYMKMYGIYQ